MRSLMNLFACTNPSLPLRARPAKKGIQVRNQVTNPIFPSAGFFTPTPPPRTARANHPHNMLPTMRAMPSLKRLVKVGFFSSNPFTFPAQAETDSRAKSIADKPVLSIIY